jgi:ribosomal protein S12 methylthiotransferase accessory factor
VHANFTLPLPTGSGCFPLTTNGLASGNHPLEAISHGLCEVVERDATAVWLQSDRDAIRSARVDLGTVDDPLCRVALEKFERAGIAVAVWEITSSIGIPTFFCGIIDRASDSLRSLHPAGGAGCHPSRSVALMRALTEAAQSRLTIISGSRDDVFREDYEEVRSQAITEQSRLVATGEPEVMRSFGDAPSFEGATFAEDLEWELDKLRSDGVDSAIVVDLTKPDVGMPVVRVVIPGLEGPTQLSTYLPGPRALARRRGGA